MGVVIAGLAPLAGIVFLGFLAVGIPIAALSLHVDHRLGFGPVIVGIVIGLQSAATVLVRHQAGTVADRKGPRHAVLLGLPLAALSGLLYLLSVSCSGAHGSLLIILVGRL